jgi:uncharacterized protein (TIGR00251 family)
VSKSRRRGVAPAPLSPEPTGGMAVLELHVQPRAARTEVVGRHGDAIKIRVHAAPADGAANEELLRFLAERLGVPRSALRLVRGASSRHKRVAVLSGPPDVERRLLGRPTS